MTDWFFSLIDDCRTIICEKGFIARWELIEMRHALGERLLQTEEYAPLSETLQRVARELNVKIRSLYYAVQFAKKFPDLNSLPEGKNVSWRAICLKYLPEHKEKRAAQEHTESLKPPLIINMPEPSSSKSYVEFVKECPCIICGKKPTVMAHFPRTKARGNKHQKEWWVIPLCAECHGEQHVNEKEWQWIYRINWAEYFFSFIEKIFKKGE